MTDTNRTGIDLSTRAWGELVLLSVIWGASFFSIAIALREIGPVTVGRRRAESDAFIDRQIETIGRIGRCPGRKRPGRRYVQPFPIERDML